MTNASPGPADAAPPLDRRLPAEMALGADIWLLHYRRYPVFSPKWLLWRAALFGVCFLMTGVFSGFGYAVLTRSYRIGAEAAFYAVASMFVIYFIGPALATAVRSRWPRGRSLWVVVAVLVGFVVSYLLEEWANTYFKALLDSTPMKAIGSDLKISEGEKTFSHVLNIGWRVTMYVLLGGGLALHGYFRELRRWREAQQQRALDTLRAQKQASELRLGVLQAQVEPHFLFNSLASVRALVRQDPDRAEATLDALVDYLRATIPKFRDVESAVHSTLGQQLDICTSYLEVMRIRTGGRLQYAIEVEPALRTMEYPPMLLITLVENAVKHGIEPKRGPGRVKVIAVREGDRLRVDVEDDGVGLQPGIGGGLGLANLRAQLDALFGARAGFELRGLAGQGTQAVLWIPIDGGGT
jgi:signal transduction histidine kinase